VSACRACVRAQVRHRALEPCVWRGADFAAEPRTEFAQNVGQDIAMAMCRTRRTGTEQDDTRPSQQQHPTGMLALITLSHRLQIPGAKVFDADRPRPDLCEHVKICRDKCLRDASRARGREVEPITPMIVATLGGVDRQRRARECTLYHTGTDTVSERRVHGTKRGAPPSAAALFVRQRR